MSRPVGTKNKRTLDALKALGDGILPLDYMLSVLRDESADPIDRRWAAGAAAPYLYPRPAQEQRTIEIELPDTSTIDGVAKAMDAIAQAAGRGELSPGEARDMTGLMEARLKAIESIELNARISKLEARAQ